MTTTTAESSPRDRRAQEKQAQEEEARERRKAEQAVIVTALQAVLETDEQLLGFARGRIAGGWRGKLAVGPEAFFAPYVNVGLTERRLLLQHIAPDTGRPTNSAPHAFPLADIADIQFADIETFGGEMAGRFVVRQANENHIRLRLRGDLTCEDAQALAAVFRALTDTGPRPHRPTETICADCAQVLEQPFRFCPYCGAVQTTPTAAPEPMGDAGTTPAPAADTAAETADPDLGTDRYEQPTSQPLSDALAEAEQEGGAGGKQEETAFAPDSVAEPFAPTPEPDTERAGFTDAPFSNVSDTTEIGPDADADPNANREEK